MSRMDGMSADLIAENIALLKTLFPEAVTEGKVDFEVLKALLGGEIEQRQEYYKFTWNGKEAARAYARTRSMGTLRPCVEESSGKDGTPGKFDSENLYIEGDNLEVLKLLQGPYHKRVKMIYIDPPYNTGHDFVYPDNFKDSIGNYKALTGQTDDEGKATRATPETSGRYHTDWLNMMLPRLILAQSLLADDGVIFISIDDSEIDNLKKLCNEVLGEENFIAQLIWKSKSGGANDSEFFAVDHEYVVVYAKNAKFFTLNIDTEATVTTVYNRKDEKGEYSLDRLDKQSIRYSASLDYEIIGPDGQSYLPKHKDPAHPNASWRWSKEHVKENYDELVFENGCVYTKNYKKDGAIARSLLLEDRFGRTRTGKTDCFDLFDIHVFSNPKPYKLIRFLEIIASDKNAVIIDFFSGSATTAHATMQLNAEDGGNRKFIMVQLPEILTEQTNEGKNAIKFCNAQGFLPNICSLGKERIRRAARKIKGEHPDWNGDMGFKVFKLDTSNLLPWNPNADELEQNLFAAVDNVLEGRSTDDLLYEILLKCNLPLTLPIETKQCGSNTIYLAGAGALAICLDKNIPAAIAEEIVRLRDEYAPIVPMQVVFRDNGFNDVTKTNALQILKQAGFEEKAIRTI